MENNYIHDCAACSHRCDGKSKKAYYFKSDAAYSEQKERQFIDRINTLQDYSAVKWEQKGYPDIKVTHKPGGKEFFIEIKAQRRTFMSVQKHLKQADLVPSETVACNLSDFLRYVEIHKNEQKPVFEVWCLENRPCIVEEGHTNYYYADIESLYEVYLHYGDKRRFRRDEGEGDVVNGVHKGVVVNYHFSLNELLPVHLLEILEKGIK